MATQQNAQRMPAGDEDRLHLADMSNPKDVLGTFDYRAKNSKLDVFAPDGSVTFPDLFQVNKTSSPMAFVTRDRFSKEEMASVKAPPKVEQAKMEQPRLNAPVEAGVQSPVRAPEAQAMPLSDQQEMQRRMAEIHPLPMPEASAGKFASIERGSGFGGSGF